MDWNKISSSYLNVDEDRSRIIYPFLCKVLKKKAPKSLLDFGGGDGAFAEYVKNDEELCSTINTIGVLDSSLKMRQQANARLEKYQIEIGKSVQNFKHKKWDVITQIAVWMCIDSDKKCIKMLNDVRTSLKNNGLFLPVVTHPCFRNNKFRTYSTNFDMSMYLESGVKFKVSINDGKNKLNIVDTHWNLSDMFRQLSLAGFTVNGLHELPDLKKGLGVPWLVLECRVLK